jgi:valyl-tRNA synthetase
LQQQSNVIVLLAGLDEAELKIAETLDNKPKDAAALVVGPVEIYLPLAGMIDLAEERTRLEKELKEATSQIERLEKLLAGDFASKAPPALVQKEREKLEGYRKTAEKIEAQLN